MRHLSIKELWIQASYRKKDFQLVSVDTLLNWADIGTKTHTSGRLSSLLRQMPLRFREEQTQHALAGLVKSNDNSVQGKIVMHVSIQKGVTNALVEKIAMRGSIRRMTTKIVGNQKSRCASEIVS